MQSYDPNYSFGKHTIEITFQKWEFVKTVTVNVWGNLKGSQVLEEAVEVYSYKLYDEQGARPTIILKDENNNSLSWTIGEEDRLYLHELEKACVSLKIVDFTPEGERN